MKTRLSTTLAFLVSIALLTSLFRTVLDPTQIASADNLLASNIVPRARNDVTAGHSSSELTASLNILYYGIDSGETDRFEGLAATVTTITDASVINEPYLSQFDVFYVGYGAECNLGSLSGQSTAIQNYISNGGGVILEQPSETGYHCEFLPLGFEVTVANTYWPEEKPLEFTSAGQTHPMLESLTPDDLPSNYETVYDSGLGSSYVRLARLVSYPNIISLAVGQHGNGRIVFHTGNLDSFPDDRGSDAFVERMLEWVAGTSRAGFRPNPDGFSMSNPPLENLGLTTSWTTFEKAFDDITGANELAARLFVYPVIYSGHFDGSGGHCHGMASVSLLVYLDRLGTDWKAWEPGISTLYDITSFKNTMSRFGNRERGPDVYQAAQLSVAEVDRFLEVAESSATVSDVFQEIKDALSDGEPIILSFVKKIEGDLEAYLNSPMHSDLAYRYEEVSTNEARVYIYEVNNPGDDNRYVTLYLDTNRFSYPSTVYSTDNGYKLMTMSLSVLTNPDVRKLATFKHGMELVSEHADLTIIGISGNMIGKLGNLIVDQIPGATMLRAFVGGSENVPVYILPTNQTYSSTVSGKSNGSYDYVSIRPNGALMIGDSEISAGGEDQVVFNANSTQFSYQTNQAHKSFSAGLLRQGDAWAREFGMENTTLSLGEILTARTESEDNSLVIINDGGSKSYDLILRQVTSDHSTFFIHRDVSLDANDTHIAQPADWNDLLNTQVVLQVDRGSDGVIDETLTLDNQLERIYLPLVQKTGSQCDTHTASMALSATATTLEVGEVVTVTATLFNEGCVALGLPQYRLYVQSDEPQPIFDPNNPEPVVHYLAVAPGQSDAAEFVLRAVESGQAVLTASASFEVHLGYPGPAYWGYSSTGPLVITVTRHRAITSPRRSAR